MKINVSDDAKGKYLQFLSDNRKFALSFQDIRAILMANSIEPIPEFPYYFAGSCISDGHNIPVIDARLRFGFQPSDVTDRSCIVTCYVYNNDELFRIGILVDTVTVMMEVDESQIEPFKAINKEAFTRYLTGVFIDEGQPCYIVSPLLMINDQDIDVLLDS